MAVFRNLKTIPWVRHRGEGRSQGPGMLDILGFLLPAVNTAVWRARCRAKAKGRGRPERTPGN